MTNLPTSEGNSEPRPAAGTAVAASVEQAWFPLSAMRRRGVPVIIARPGYEHLAIVAEDKPSRVLHWHMLHTRPRVRIGDRFARWGVAGDRCAPQAWRPVPGVPWPDPLPEPLAHWQPPREPGQHSPPPETEPDDPTQSGDGWPYPRLRLGERVPPVSIEECEARLLRALRTSASRETGSVGIAHRNTCADIPAEFVKIALRYEHAEALRRGDYSPETHAVRSGWTPVRRDIEDWLYALGWINGLHGRALRTLEMRAADPAFSFRAIAAALRISAQGAHDLYRGAVRRAYRTATEGQAG